MTKSIPTIGEYMTPSPHTVGADRTLRQAHELLREYRIRHLPVLRGGQLVGMLTDRDLALVEALENVDARTVSVEEAMSSEVYTVSPSTHLDTVVTEMAARKMGSAIIVQNNKVVGIFTMIDACAALAQLLQGRTSN